MNYREIQDRFTHIDATFVGWRLGFPDEGSYLAVRIYPWWEHPRYVEACRRGESWGFGGGALDEGAKEVRVYPLGLVSFRFSQTDEIIDWAFVESGPLLWPYEDEGTLFVNSSLDWDALLPIISRELGLGIPFLRNQTPLAVPMFDRHQPPFALQLPASLFAATQRALAHLGVETLVTHIPAVRVLPRGLSIDDTDFIIARDFEVDLPEFEHRDEWFQPKPRR